MWTETEHPTPLGIVRLVRDAAGTLHALGFTDGWDRVERWLARQHGPQSRRMTDAPAVTAALDAYFAGVVGAIAPVPIAIGGSPFQHAVWQALRTIPVGTTSSYGDLARQVGRPTAVRAVGAANGANPIWLLVPCHRAIGRDGRLVGYAGGLDRKRWLLAHEAHWVMAAAAGHAARAG